MVRELDQEWLEFCSGVEMFDEATSTEHVLQTAAKPECGPLYISTKTKICYLSAPVELNKTFWNIPVTPYSTPAEGVIKKQMKFCSNTPAELEAVEARLRHELETRPNYSNTHSITHVENPNGLIRFKDVRKISIGLSKKDIVTNRGKKKSAFYNCFVVIIRIRVEGCYREFNVKVFNTGKLEIPGIQDDRVLEQVLQYLTALLSSITQMAGLTHQKENETVLINSNFKCNYLIQRDPLVDILKTKYKIKCSYDPCSYPGIQCTFFYDPRRAVQTGVQPSDDRDDISRISFMIFRTGSVLIVGRCSESVLDEIYRFIRTVLQDEHPHIADTTSSAPDVEPLHTKKRRKTFHIEL